jgi:hypothetical protein
MHSYIKTDGLYTVGIYHPRNYDDGTVAWEWYGLKDFTREYDAAAFAAFMNGGGDVTPMDAARFTELHRLPSQEQQDEETTA